MKTAARFLAFTLLLLTLSCGDNDNSSLTPRTIGGIPADKAFLYVSNTSANTISAFLVDNTSGILQAVAGSPFPSGGIAPGRVAVSTASRLLFVVNQSTASIASHHINSEIGSLIPGSTFPTEDLPVTLVLHPAFAVVYVLSRNGLISGFSFDANGIFTPLPGSPWSLGVGATNAQDIAIDPRSPFLFATSDAGISVFQIADNGSLILPASTFPNTGLAPTGLAFNPVNGFLYSLDFAQGVLFGWEFTSLTGLNVGLQPLPGTPTPVGTNPTWISILPNGSYAYIATANGIIEAFTLDINGTPLRVIGSPFAAPTSVVQIAIDPVGGFLYTASPGTAPLGLPPGPDAVHGFTIQADTGQLLPIAGSPFAIPSPGGAIVARFPSQQ